MIIKKRNFMDTRIKLADDLYNRHKYVKAMDLYSAIISQDPENVIAYQGFSDCLFFLKEYQKSYEAAQKAVAIQPDLARSHYRSAAILFNWKQYRESEEELRRALELEPNSAYSLSLLGGILFFKNEDLEGITLIQKSLEIDPHYWYAHSQMGAIWLRKKRLKEAYQEYRKAFVLRPTIKNGIIVASVLLNRLSKPLIILLSIAAFFLSIKIRNMTPILPFIFLFYLGSVYLLKNKEKTRAVVLFVLTTIVLALGWMAILR
jgi:tetratricopeptide (TPR) repeat protein